MKNVPVTPMRVPSQISAWNAPQRADSGQIIGDTPHAQAPLRLSPHATRIGQKSSEIFKKSVFLPGFQNSFVTTPLKLGTQAGFKGKAKDLAHAESLEILGHAASQKAEPPNAIFHQGSVDNLEFGDNIDLAPTSDDPIPHVDEDGDTIMLEDAAEEEVEQFEPLNHKAEVCTAITFFISSLKVVVALSHNFDTYIQESQRDYLSAPDRVVFHGKYANKRMHRGCSSNSTGFVSSCR
jgi:hypothetical protein